MAVAGIADRGYAGGPITRTPASARGAFINSRTGRFLRHANLGAQLMDFIANASRYDPREWAQENGLSCFDSTAVLNAVLKRAALARGENWTQDIAVLHWRPNPVLVSPEDQQRLQPEFDEIDRRFGFKFGKN